MAINAKDIDKALDYTFTAANRVKDFSKLARRNSIMKMADPAMYQYPILMSNGIETPVAMAIAQAYQHTYAASVVTAYSLNPVMYMEKYKEPSDFVQKFHSNSGIPTNFRAAANALGATVNESATEVEEVEFDAEVTDASINSSFSTEALESYNIRAWDNVEDYVDNSSLNNIYRPYDRTQRILSEKVESLRVANEGLKESFNKLNGFMDDVNSSVTNNPNEQSNVSLGAGKTYHQASARYDKDGNLIEVKDAGVKSVGRVDERRYTNAVVRNDRLDAMEPSMVNVQVVCHSKTAGQFTQNLVIGVKAMVRLVASDLMIASISEACKDSNFIFKFLKWTRGEKKTLDFVLGISSAKKKALEKNAKMETRILKQSQKRGKNGLLKRALNNEVLPTLTVVLTTYEVEKIKEICGVDLTDLKQAVRLMNKYYLLSIAIYDPAQNILQSLFDCDDDWSFVHIGAMKSMVNKATDLLNQNELQKMFGRR